MKTEIQNTPIITVPTHRKRLKQVSFPHHDYVLSIGYGKGHYASWVVGGRWDEEGSQHFPTTFELAVLDKNGKFYPLTSCDDVAGWQPIDMIEIIVDRMSRRHFDIAELKYFCD